MARPRKTGLEYFPFDVDFFEDEKIVAIAGEFGLKGEITAVKLLCAVYRNGYFIEWSEMLRMKMLRSLPGISPELLEQIVARLVKWEFFDKHLFDSVRVLTSKGIQRRFLNGSRKRLKMQQYPYWLIPAPEMTVSAPETPPQPTFPPPEMPQSKVKKKKKSTVVDTKETTTTTTPVKLSLEEEIKILSTDQPWLATITRLYHLPPGRAEAELAEFHLFCRANAIPGHDTPDDARAHFNAWLRRRLQDEGEKHRKSQATRRRDEQARAERRRAAEQRERDAFTPPPGYTSLTWYRELTRRAAGGDHEAQRILTGGADVRRPAS